MLLHYHCADTGIAQDVYWLHMHCSCLLNQWAQVVLVQCVHTLWVNLTSMHSTAPGKSLAEERGCPSSLHLGQCTQMLSCAIWAAHSHGPASTDPATGIFFWWFNFFTFYSSGSNSRAPELRSQCTCSLQQVHIISVAHLQVLSHVFLGAHLSINSL